MSGLICLNWYDWNSLVRVCWVKFTNVGIDLPELIRLKRYWNLFLTIRIINVGIDLPELIRLKPRETTQPKADSKPKSGLICLNWYDWNANRLMSACAAAAGRDWSAWIDTIETQSLTILPVKIKVVGIDLPELIRLKLVAVISALAVFAKSGLICLNWYDWNA